MVRHLDISLELEQLIHSDALPQKIRNYSQTLLEQLERPVRVMLCGALGADKAGLLDALLQKSFPRLEDASLHLHNGDRVRASYHYSDGEVLVRDHTRTPSISPSDASLTRVDVTLPDPCLQDLTLCLPSQDEEQAMRRGEDGTSLADSADMVLWCTDSFAGVEAAQWQAVPDALKDHSFLVYLVSRRPLQRARLKRLRQAGESEFHRLETVDLRSVGADGAAQLMAELLKVARRGKAAEEDAATLFVDAHRDHIAPSAAHPQIAEVKRESQAIAPEKNSALQTLYGEALHVIRAQASALIDPLPQDSDAETSRVLQLCAEAAESVAALFDGHEDPDPAYCFVKEEVLSTADRLLLMSMEQGLGPAIDAATTLLQMRRDFDFQIDAISGGSFTRSKAISPIDQRAHA